MNRRGWLVLMTSVLGATLLRPQGGQASDSTSGNRVTLDAWLAPDDASRRIGRRYLSLRPEEKDPARLASLLLPEPEAELPGDLQRRIRTEMEDGATLYLEGWLLTETEARLCAWCVLASGV